VSLFFHSDPSAIAGLVSPVVVDAVNSQSRRWLAHVSEDVFEGLPSFANRDAARAVTGVICIVWVEAAVHYRRPSGVQRGPRASGRMAVFEVAGDKFVPMGAPATGYASPDIADRSDGGVSTVAAAFPDELFPLPATETQSDEASETLAGDILESGHDGYLPELLCQEAARRFSGEPPRFVLHGSNSGNRDFTIFCGRLQ
jgi:hypothetical protein